MFPPTTKGSPKDGDLFQFGLEPCGVRTCQDKVSPSSVCTAVTQKTKHKTENTVNNTELALVLGVTTPSTIAWLKHSNYLKQSGIKEASLYGNFRARARQANSSRPRSQEVSKESAFHLWRLACSETDKSNSCSHENSFPRSDVWMPTSQCS